MNSQTLRTGRKRDGGYALLAMLAGLTITLVVLAAAASNPSAQFISQRENEEEAMYRALQVASAIQSYATIKGGLTPQNLPTKLEDLTQEININAKPIHLVRRASMVDPLTNSEWKPVRLGDPLVRDFLKAFMQDMVKQQSLNLASGAAAAQQTQEIPPLLQMAMQAGGINLASLNSDDENSGQRGSSISGFSLSSDSDSRPIIGVVSRSTKRLIRNYYGIDSYDKALFVSGSQPSNLSFPVMVLGGGVPATGDSGDSGLSPYKGPSFGPCQRTGIRDPRCDGK